VPLLAMAEEPSGALLIRVASPRSQLARVCHSVAAMVGGGDTGHAHTPERLDRCWQQLHLDVRVALDSPLFIPTPRVHQSVFCKSERMAV
jgi:hypothetical protein